MMYLKENMQKGLNDVFTGQNSTRKIHLMYLEIKMEQMSTVAVVKR